MPNINISGFNPQPPPPEVAVAVGRSGEREWFRHWTAGELSSSCEWIRLEYGLTEDSRPEVSRQPRRRSIHRASVTPLNLPD